MIELYLIGYTEDGEHLVLDLDPDGDGRYTVPIDPDLLATVEQLRERRIVLGLPVDLREPPVPATSLWERPDADRDREPAPQPEVEAEAEIEPDPEPEPASEPEPEPAPAPEPEPDPAARPEPELEAEREPSDDAMFDERPDAEDVLTREVSLAPSAPLPPARSPGSAGSPDEPGTRSRPTPTGRAARPVPPRGPTGGSTATPRVTSTPRAAPVPTAAPDRSSSPRDAHRPSALAQPLAKLTPAEIQAQLRAGRSVRAVASAAGTDTAWIERWLPPIIAERERVLAEARRRRIDAPRARQLGNAVAQAFTARGVDGRRAAWSATRRADGRWRVSVRFEEGGRPRTATWLMDPEGNRVSPASALAEVLSRPDAGERRRR